MKSVLIIGMGRFGRHLARKMHYLGNDVMVVDKDEKIISSLCTDFTDSSICDCTNENVMRTLGVDQFDICFVTIGEDFQSSLVITSILKKLGAKFIVSKANQDIQAELLRNIGANEVVYPEREMAEKLAIRYNAKNIFDFIQLTSEYSIYEIPILEEWVGKTIMEINVRRKYKVNIIATKLENDLNPVPGADYVFQKGDHIVVIGRAPDVYKLVSKT